MNGVPPSIVGIRSKLLEAVRAERKDALLFSFLTVLLTPVFVAVSVFILLVALSQFGYRGNGLYNGAAFVHGTVFFLAFACVAYFLQPRGPAGLGGRELVWFGAALAMFALLLLLSYGTSLRKDQPGLFWWIDFGLAIFMLGILGRGYVPQDHYYVRQGDWGFGDSLVDREIEQADFWLGCAVAFPRMILGSYGDVFGGLWLWQGIGERASWIAAEVLHSLRAHDAKGAEGRLLSASPKESGRAVRWLLRLKFVRYAGSQLVLASEGERFLETSEWTAA